MAGPELAPSPTDEQTGLPLLTLPVDTPRSQFKGLHENYHHKWFRRYDPRLRSYGGLSLKYSFGQQMPTWQHELLHRLDGGPPLPDKEDQDEQFRLAVLGCAALVSPYAIDVTRDNWQEPVLMTADQYAYVTDPRRVHIETYSLRRARVVRTYLGKFFASFVLEQELTSITPRTIKAFVHTKDPVRRRELGNLLLREAVEAAVEPLKPIKYAFAEAYDRPDVHGWDLGLKVRKFFPLDRFGDYHDILRQRLKDNEPTWQ